MLSSVHGEYMYISSRPCHLGYVSLCHFPVVNGAVICELHMVTKTYLDDIVVYSQIRQQHI